MCRCIRTCICMMSSSQALSLSLLSFFPSLCAINMINIYVGMCVYIGYIMYIMRVYVSVNWISLYINSC